jgi:hypothetical protein
MLSVIRPNVVTLNAVMLSVVAPLKSSRKMFPSFYYFLMLPTFIHDEIKNFKCPQY